MVLSFIPVIGIIIYFFFGQNFRKERIISQRSLDELTKRSMLEFAEQRNLHLPEKSRQLLKLFANQSMALPFKDNSVDIYTDGYDLFLSLLRDIGRAQDHIHIDTYTIENDPLGRLICDALIDKARQGVEVRLIYDDVGCWVCTGMLVRIAKQTNAMCLLPSVCVSTTGLPAILKPMPNRQK
jgi:cardiolipin synthase